MKSTFKIHFYVNRSKEKNGKVPIMGRITINGQIAQFSCKQSVKPELWDSKGNKATGKSKEASNVNFALENIRAQIVKHYQRLSYKDSYVSAEMVKNAFQGIGEEYETLLGAFDRENEEFGKRVGKDRSKKTYQKYIIVRKYLAEFIRYKYKRSDILINDLTEEFIQGFCLYLKNVAGLAQSSVWIYSIPLKHIVTSAHMNGKISRNPFARYHVTPNVKQREFLTEEELKLLSEIKLENKNWALARDLFIFGSWTGISFADIINLTAGNMVEINGAQWIISKRQKTGIQFQIKLLEVPAKIIKKYKRRKTGPIFNVSSLDIVNRQLKKVAKLCGIEKNISFHLARHSFAVRALNFGMPMESVSKILGHTKITTTQIYASALIMAA